MSYYPHAIYHYATDEQIEAMVPEWERWLTGRNYSTSALGASYSGYRCVEFSFEDEEEAALFRVFFGGSLSQTFVPTLNRVAP